jgi:hypothetical protein
MAYGTVNADVIGTSVAGSNLGAGNATQFKNRIINGAMVIDQRNAGAAVTAAAAYVVDRFNVGNSTDGAFSAERNTNAPSGFINSIKYTVTTADTSLTTTQTTTIQQAIEGFNIADLGWGTANAKTVTLSFWVRSSLTGTFGGSLRNSASNRSYPFTYSISAADTWEQKSVTIAGDTSGTWLTDNGTGIRLTFSMGAGPDRSGTAGAWNSNNNTSATGAVSVIGTLNATWYITGVQLEVGESATGFDYRPYGTELSLCQRYYYRTTPENSGRIAVGFASSTTTGDFLFFLPVTMRIAPTALEQSGTANDYIIVYSGTATACSAVPTLQSGTNITVGIRGTISSGLTQGDGCQLRSTDTDGYLGWSAEL